MKIWQYALVIIFGLAILITMLSLIPAAGHIISAVISILAFIWKAIESLLLSIAILGYGALTGFTFKHYLISSLDAIFDRDQELTPGMHWGIAIVFGFIFGTAHSLLMMLVMGWNTWIRAAATTLGWPGYYETPPVFWLIFSLATFVFFYLNTPYLPPSYWRQKTARK
jgi:Fe2+ transport system protein B